MAGAKQFGPATKIRYLPKEKHWCPECAAALTAFNAAGSRETARRLREDLSSSGALMSLSSEVWAELQAQCGSEGDESINAARERLEARASKVRP